MRNNFELIYLLAKAKNKEGLRSLLQNNDVSIDQFQARTFGYTAAARLAAEGDQKALELLITLGANQGFIQYGAALKGRTNIETISDKNINWVIYGTAQSGNLILAERLCEQFNGDRQWLVAGAIMGGATVQADEMIIKYRLDEFWLSFFIGLSGNFSFAMCFLARGGNHALVLEGSALAGHTLISDQLVWSSLYPLAVARGAARGGDIQLAEHCRLHFNLSIDLLAEAAASGGHLQYAERLRTLGANISVLGRGAAYGGQIKYARYLKELGALGPQLAEGAVIGGHIDFAEELRGAYSINNTSMIRWALEGGQTNYIRFLLGCLPQKVTPDKSAETTNQKLPSFASLDLPRIYPINKSSQIPQHTANPSFAELRLASFEARLQGAMTHIAVLERQLKEAQEQAEKWKALAEQASTLKDNKRKQEAMPVFLARPRTDGPGAESAAATEEGLQLRR